MLAEGWSPSRVTEYTAELTSHACVLQARVDAKPGAFREFAVVAARYSRSRHGVGVLFAEDIDGDGILERAVDALHDLIMEGV